MNHDRYIALCHWLGPLTAGLAPLAIWARAALDGRGGLVAFHAKHAFAWNAIYWALGLPLTGLLWLAAALALSLSGVIDAGGVLLLLAACLGGWLAIGVAIGGFNARRAARGRVLLYPLHRRLPRWADLLGAKLRAAAAPWLLRRVLSGRKR